MKFLIVASFAVMAVASPASAQSKVGQTRDAVSTGAERRFRAMDSDANGNVSSAEFTAAAAKRAGGDGAAKPRRATKMFAKADANADGTLTLDEYKARMLAQFDARDLNKNGKIDADEVPAAAAGGTPE